MVGGPAQRPAGASPRSSRASAGCARMPDRRGKRRGANPRGGEGAGRRRLAPPPRCPPAAPAPFLACERTPRTGHRLSRCVHLCPFLRIPLWTHPTFSRLLVPKVLGLRRCLTRKDEAHKRCWGNLLYSPTPQTSAGFSAGGPSIREFRSLPHTVSLFPFTAVELKSCTFLIQRPK